MPSIITRGAMSAAAFGWTGGAASLLPANVFTVSLYTGTGASQSITNGLNLSGKGGLVWTKDRSASHSNGLFDTVNGVGKFLSSDNAGSQQTDATSLTAFNSNGFSMGANTGGNPVINNSGDSYVAWSFVKAAKFFDIQPYTGNGSSQVINHNLGIAPGLILVKSNTNGSLWPAWHTSFSAGGYIILDATGASGTDVSYFGNNSAGVLPTSSSFTIGSEAYINNSGDSFVAYIFAHDPSASSIIKCGTFITSGGAATVTVGWQPQYVMMKSSSGASAWLTIDSTRGSGKTLFPNTTAAEDTTTYSMTPSGTGFSVTGLAASATYIYMAIHA